MSLAFQDYLPDNSCFGCGPNNEQGLRIKSFWSPDVPGDTVCEFRGGAQHNAGSANILNGGIIATIMDCHSVMTAIAQAYREVGRPIGSNPVIWFVTGGFDLSYRAPALLHRSVHLRARVVEATQNKSVVNCELWSAAKVCTTSSMAAVRVSPQWHDV